MFWRKGKLTIFLESYELRIISIIDNLKVSEPHALIISYKASDHSGFYRVNFIFPRSFLFFLFSFFSFVILFLLSEGLCSWKGGGWACMEWQFLHFVEIEIPRSVLLLLFIFLLFFIIIFGVIYVH